VQRYKYNRLCGVQAKLAEAQERRSVLQRELETRSASHKAASEAAQAKLAELEAALQNAQVSA